MDEIEKPCELEGERKKMERKLKILLDELLKKRIFYKIF